MSDLKLSSQNGAVLSNPRKGWAVGFQSLILFFCISGIAILMFESKTLFDALNLFSYYTIQSNLLVAVAMVFSIRMLVKNQEDSSFLVIFKSGAVLWILVTGIVYHFMLSGLVHFQGLTAFAVLALHYVTPLGLVANWLIFEKKGRYRYIFTLYWLSYPLLYLLGSWIRGWLTGFYPYWFLNPAQSYPEGAGSVRTVLMIVAGLFLAFYFIGLLIVFTDSMISRRFNHR